MNLDHLTWPTEGWGYMPPQDDVYAAFRYVQEHYTPKSIFEIGFCWGHSTTYQLEIMPQAKMTTCGPIEERMNKEAPDPKERLAAIEKMKEVYGDRFQHLQGRTYILQHTLIDTMHRRFDYGLIDGAHDKTSVEIDATLCQDMGIPIVLVDNWDQRQVRETVLKYSDYEELKVFDYEQTWKGKYRVNQIGLCTL